MSKLKYLNIKNVTDTTADLYFYGAIVGDEWEKWCDTDTCPQDVIEALKQAEGKDLNIYINSPGGSVFSGLAIYNMLKRHGGKKTCYVDGLAASIASVICMAGDEIIMPSNAYLMIHNPSNIVWGNAKDMRKMADDLDVIQEGIEEVYKTKLKVPYDIKKIKDLMDAETWLTAKDATEYFLVTVAEENKAVAMIDGEAEKIFRNIPRNLLKPKDTNELKEEEIIRMELELMDI